MSFQESPFLDSAKLDDKRGKIACMLRSKVAGSHQPAGVIFLGACQMIRSLKVYVVFLSATFNQTNSSI